MQEHIFLAGATGALGRVLGPILVATGYRVSGTTRHPDRTALLEKLGIEPVVVDVFDRNRLAEVMVRCAPSIVIHQLTDLPAKLDPALMAQAVVRNARIRREGTRNLVDAAVAAGCRRLVLQSIAWAYAPGPLPYHEESPLDMHAQGTRRISIDGVMALEQCGSAIADLDVTILRYGQLYGPGTANMQASGSSPVHVNAAAKATLLALQRTNSGIFNITEDHGEASNRKAREQLLWLPD